MGSYNGLVASKTLDGSTVSQTLGVTAFAYVTAANAVPMKFFPFGQFAVQTKNGVSGTIGVYVVGSVGGATYIIAGRSNITAVGGFPVPLYNYVGLSGSVTNSGIPRPAYVQFANHGAAVAGFTASVSLAAEY